MAGKPGERRLYVQLLAALGLPPPASRASVVDLEQSALRLSLVCFGVAEAREAISGDVQLARRFDEFSLKRWSADAEFEALVGSILRNLPLREPSALSARSLRRLLQVADGLTSRAFRALNELAVEAIASGREQVTDEAVERWTPVFDAEAAFA